MPVEAPVVTAAHSLGQARGIVKPGLIGMNSECFRRMIDRFTALRAGPEKRAKAIDAIVSDAGRSEERRVGKECVRRGRSRWSPDHTQNKTTTSTPFKNKNTN